jgi:cytochrome c
MQEDQQAVQGLPARQGTSRPLLFAAIVLAVAACGTDTNAPPAADVLTAATLPAEAPKPVAEYLAEPRFATASRELGDRLLFQCTACHSLEAGGANMLGPNLHGIFGRKSASTPGFGYTRAMQTADFTWTPRSMDAWIAQPARFLPGNAMAYPGLRNADDRAALIASLLRQTAAEE